MPSCVTSVDYLPVQAFLQFAWLWRLDGAELNRLSFHPASAISRGVALTFSNTTSKQTASKNKWAKYIYAHLCFNFCRLTRLGAAALMVFVHNVGGFPVFKHFAYPLALCSLFA